MKKIMKRIRMVVLLSILSLLTQQTLGFFVPLDCSMQSDQAEEMNMESMTSDIHAAHAISVSPTSKNLIDEHSTKDTSGCESHNNCSKSCLMHAFFLPMEGANYFLSSVVGGYASAFQQSPFSVFFPSFKPPVLS